MIVSSAVPLSLLGMNLGSMMRPWGLGDGVLAYAGVSWQGVRGQTAPHFAYPFGWDSRYFPSTDLVPLAFARALSWVLANPFVGVNLLIFISFPLMAGACWWVMRILKIGVATGLVLSLAATALPFHIYRLEHSFLVGGIYALPLGLALALILQSGAMEGLLTLNGMNWKTRALIGLAVVVVAWSGIYWSAFALGLLALALLFRMVRRTSWQAWAVNLVPVIAVGILALLPLLPSLIGSDAADSGRFQRFPIESVVYSGQLADALLPSTQSGLPLANFPALQLQEINDWASTVGALGVRWVSNHGSIFVLLGFVAFLVVLIAPASYWSPLLRERQHKGVQFPLAEQEDSAALRFLVFVVVSIMLFLVPYGLSSLVATVLTPQIRAWDRLIPLLQIVLITISGVVFTKLSRNWGRAWSMRVRVALVVAGVFVVFVDSIVPAIGFYRDQLRAAEVRLSEAQVVAQLVAGQVGTNCAIYQLPYIPFPEAAPLNELGVYDPLWLGLASSTNMWSYGGVAGSEQDAWLVSVESRLPDSVVELKARGFCGVLLDERGFTAATLAEAQQRLGEKLGPPLRLQGARQPGKESSTGWLLWRLDGVN